MPQVSKLDKKSENYLEVKTKLDICHAARIPSTRESIYERCFFLHSSKRSERFNAVFDASVKDGLIKQKGEENNFYTTTQGQEFIAEHE
jgi:hypothetical protein